MLLRLCPRLHQLDTTFQLGVRLPELSEVGSPELCLQMSLFVLLLGITFLDRTFNEGVLLNPRIGSLKQYPTSGTMFISVSFPSPSDRPFLELDCEVSMLPAIVNIGNQPWRATYQGFGAGDMS